MVYQHEFLNCCVFLIQVSVIKAKINEMISMPVGKQKLQFEVCITLNVTLFRGKKDTIVALPKVLFCGHFKIILGSGVYI